MTNYFEKARAALLSKAGLAIVTVATIVSVGSIATVSAAHDPSPIPGYTKDQCKHDGWKNFKNPDGSPMFKNQGDCVSFFVTGGQNTGDGQSAQDKNSLAVSILASWNSFLAVWNNFWTNFFGWLHT